MRILFVNTANYLEAALPEGIAILSAILKLHGHEVRLFDTTFLKPKGYGANILEGKKAGRGLAFHKATPYTLRDLVRDDPEVDIAEKFAGIVSGFRPELIAFSTMTTNYEHALRLANAIDIKTRVIFGGVHPTLMPEQVIEEKRVDYVCVGEGDSALPELCRFIEQDKDVSTIRNLYIKNGNGRSRKITKNNLRPYVNLDEVPPPDLDIFDPRYLFRPFMGSIYKGIFMSTSRGCPRGCAYCVNNRLKSLFAECGNKYVRFQSPEVVARNVKGLNEKYGINWIKFSDDSFLMRPLKDVEALKDLLKPLGIMFGCSVDPGTVTEEKVRLAKEMGCVAMSIGVETGNEKIRKYVLGRHITNTQIRRAIAIVKGHGIKISTFNMIGLPGETKENVYETIRLNKELQIPDANTYILYPFPGTKIYSDGNVALGKKIPVMEKAHLFNMSKMSTDDLLFFLKAFNLFLVLPERYWQQIERSRHDAGIYDEMVSLAQRTIDRGTG